MYPSIETIGDGPHTSTWTISSMLDICVSTEAKGYLWDFPYWHDEQKSKVEFPLKFKLVNTLLRTLLKGWPKRESRRLANLQVTAVAVLFELEI